jgi:oligopeptide transport system substrate-binding protein
VVLDESTGARLFESGRLDVLTRVPAYDRERLAKQGVLRKDVFHATYFLGFNVRKEPFRDRLWRRAVAGAIRREELCALLATGERAASSWIPEGLEGAESYRAPEGVLGASVQAFRARAAETGRAGGQPAIAIGYDAGGRNALVLEKVQFDLLKNLGLRLELAPLDWKSHVRQLSVDAPPLFRFGIQAPFADPIFHLQALVTGDPNNHTGWSDPRYDRLVERIRGLASGPERAALIRRAQKLLTEEEAVVVPLFHYVQLHAVSPRLKGFVANPFGVVRFSELSLSK